MLLLLLLFLYESVVSLLLLSSSAFVLQTKSRLQGARDVRRREDEANIVYPTAFERRDGLLTAVRFLSASNQQ